MAFATSLSAFGMKPPTTGGGFSSQPVATSNPSPFSAFSTNVSSSQQPTQTSSLFTNPQNQNQNQNQNQFALGFSQQNTMQPPSQPSGQSAFSGNTWANGSTNIAIPSAQPAQNPFGNWGQQHNQNQQQSSAGLGGGGGGSIFGNPTGQQPSQQYVTSTAPQQQAPQQQAPQQQFTRTTKFNDLPEQVQKTLETVDAYVQGRIQISHDLKARSLDEEPTKGAELIRKVHNDLVNTMSALQADKTMAEELSSKVEQSVQDIVIATRIIDGFKNPQINGAYLKNHAQFPFEFFNRAAEEIKQKLQWYKSTIEQIERRLASAQNQVQYNPHAITVTLQAQNASFLALAGKTAELNSELQKVKASYRDLWRAHTGSARDPFNELDRRPGDGVGLLNNLGSLDLGR